MSGPCTLLAQPHYNRYIDAAGEHVMPWVGGEPAIGDVIFVENVTANAFPSLATNQMPVALSNVIGFSGPAMGRIAPSLPASTGDLLPSRSVTNCTKSAISIRAMLDSASFLDMNDGARSFLADNGFTKYWYGGSYSGPGGNYDTSTMLTVTGAAPTATSVTLAGTPGACAVMAVIANGQTTPRSVQIIRSGANLGPAFTIPAKTIAQVGTGAYGGFSAGQAVGVKFTDAVVGDKFGLIYLNCMDDPYRMLPVPFRADYPSTTLQNDMDGILPITTWAGTPRASVATEGERYWRVPVNRAHFPFEAAGAIVARFLPLGWPVSPPFGPFALSRDGSLPYNFEPGHWDVGLIGYPDFIGSLPSTYRVYGDWARATNQLVGPDRADTVTILQPIDYTAPPDAFWNASLEWSEHAVRYTVNAYAGESGRHGGHGADFPFAGIEPDDAPLYLYGGGELSFWRNTTTYHRDVAVFNRPLTAAETAFVNDPDAVWSFNMFAEPAQLATVTGGAATLTRGDTEVWDFEVRDADGGSVPLQGATVWRTIKLRGDPSLPGDMLGIVRHSLVIGNDGAVISSSGLSILDATAGRLRSTISPTEADQFWPGLIYVEDVQIKTIDGAITTVHQGELQATADVTRRTTTP